MKKLIFVTLVLILALGMWSSGASAAYFWFDVKGITDKDATEPPGEGDGIPDTEVTLRPCQKVWIDILISEVPKPGLVSIGSLDIFYNPEAFTWDPPVHPSMNMDDTNWSFQQKEEWRAPGYLHMEGGAPLGTSHAGDNIEVALIDFHCAAAGISSGIELEYDMMYLLDGTDISGETRYIPIKINQVPLPTPLFLLGTGLIGIIGIRRRIRG